MFSASSSKLQMLTAVVLRLSGHLRDHVRVPLCLWIARLLDEGNTPQVPEEEQTLVLVGDPVSADMEVVHFMRLNLIRWAYFAPQLAGLASCSLTECRKAVVKHGEIR